MLAVVAVSMLVPRYVVAFVGEKNGERGSRDYTLSLKLSPEMPERRCVFWVDRGILDEYGCVPGVTPDVARRRSV